jgi:3-methyladenine DNA glycosylase AlkD
LLIGDQEETIIKAISWVLREAIRYDRKAVIDFLNKNQKQLAPRIKFEVGVKLDTMMKTS